MKTFNYFENNDKERIQKFIEELFPIQPYEVQDLDDSSAHNGIGGQQLIKQIMSIIQGCFTVIVEEFHIDERYRDTYYMYFSNQHFQIERYCRRLTFMKGNYTWNSFLEIKSEEQKLKRSEDFLGTCVIKPTSEGIIGRTLLNPSFLLKSGAAYVRLSTYKVNVYGIMLEVKAFPYQMQDQETMRCSEVTLLNLMDYYSNTYKDYKNIMPSEIIKSEQKYIHERALPSRGITYHVLTRVLSDFGFAPRLYNIQAMRKDINSGITQEDELRRLLHYYIESGIPVAINVEPEGVREIGHSLICIGHSGAKSINRAKGIAKRIGGFEEKYSIINSADFYDSYVVMDDNQFPYTICDFKHMSIYDSMRVSNIAVPLYKRMFLEAATAYDIALMILESPKWGVFKWAKDYLGENTDIIIRLFLASSRSFKKARVEDFGKSSKELQVYYAKVRMPRFIWVCEMYTEEGYAKNEAFGEVVLDGTSASKKGISNVILLNYPSGLYSRNPDQTEHDIDEDKYQVEIWSTIKSYDQNLTPI